MDGCEKQEFKLRPISDLLWPRKEQKVPDEVKLNVNDSPKFSTSEAGTTLKNPMSGPMQARWKRFEMPRWLKLALKAVIAFLVIPGLMTLVGFILEKKVYGGDNTTNFHHESLIFAGLIAAPFILLRWCWVWPKHLFKLEVLFYLIHTGMFIATVVTTVIDGRTTFFIAEHVRNVFAGDTYTSISTQTNVYQYLTSALGSVYNEAGQSKASSYQRGLPGLMKLISPIRLKQSRSVPVACSTDLDKKFKKGTITECYRPYSSDLEDRSEYGDFQKNITFQYVNYGYKNYAGDIIESSDFNTPGQLGAYPLAGYWVLLPPEIDPKNLSLILFTMQSSGWIDSRTRQISLDFAVLAKDLAKPVFATVVLTIEVTASGKFSAMSPLMSFSYLAYVSSPLKKGDNSCQEVTTQSGFLRPIYLGVLPIALYTLFSLLLHLRNSYRSFFKSIYTYIEAAWVAIVLACIGYRWRSIYFSHCSTFAFDQRMWPYDYSMPVVVNEVLPQAHNWQRARQMIAIALFLYVFDSLKFMTKLAAFDAVGKTLAYALRNLASFAVSFSILLMGFVAMFYFLFAADDENYQSFPRAFATVWLVILGNVDLNKNLIETNEMYIPVIVIITFLLVFVLLTVIVAIVNDAFEKIKAEQYEVQKTRRESRVKSPPRVHPMKKGLARLRGPRRSRRHRSVISNTTAVLSNGDIEQPC